MTHVKKIATAAFAAFTMGAVMIGSTGEAKAWCGYYGCGYGYGYGAGAIAAGVATGVVLGAAAAAATQGQPRYTARRGARAQR